MAVDDGTCGPVGLCRGEHGLDDGVVGEELRFAEVAFAVLPPDHPGGGVLQHRVVSGALGPVGPVSIVPGFLRLDRDVTLDGGVRRLEEGHGFAGLTLEGEPPGAGVVEVFPLYPVNPFGRVLAARPFPELVVEPVVDVAERLLGVEGLVIARPSADEVVQLVHHDVFRCRFALAGLVEDCSPAFARSSGSLDDVVAFAPEGG